MYMGPQRREVADPGGEWTADFSTPGDEQGEEDTFDISPGSDGNVWQWDDDGDGTQVGFHVPNPNFWVSPNIDRVDSPDWPVGAEGTRTIHDPGTGPGDDHSA